MSIVQSAIDRLKKSQAEGVEKRPAARAAGFDTVAVGAARSRSALRWSGQPPANLDVERLRAAGLYPPAAFVQRIQEDYRSIRREVVAASHEKIGPAEEPVGPIVVVTSALPGDGKSYTALNLALSIASEGVHDVLLVDADSMKRSVTRACGLDERPGLMELLEKPDASFAEYSYLTTASRLYVLPAGNRSPESTDLVSAGRIGPLFHSIRSAMSGHFVITDTPPLLVASETPVLTDVAGQVLLVVRAGQSLQDSVKDAVGRIRESIPVGVVLNCWSPMLPSEKETYAAYHEYAKK